MTRRGDVAVCATCGYSIMYNGEKWVHRLSPDDHQAVPAKEKEKKPNAPHRDEAQAPGETYSQPDPERAADQDDRRDRGDQ